MPLLRFDVYEGRSDEDLKTMLDAVHTAMVSAYNVPVRDRYQIVHEHRPATMIMEDTGLDIPRTKDFVFIQVTTTPRAIAMKKTFYRLVVEALERDCGIKPSDVMINHVNVAAEDWSFGHGRAQFLTGEL